MKHININQDSNSFTTNATKKKIHATNARTQTHKIQTQEQSQSAKM